MATWFGDGLPSLSNLKGQITNFTKEVLSEGIVEEIDERTEELDAANKKCVELQELLNSKDAEISLLRRQNIELQKTVVELNEKSREQNEDSQDDGGGGFYWDPQSVKNRNAESQKQTKLLQEQLAQASMRICELESELKRLQKVNTANGTNMKEETAEGHQKTELLRAKQDMMNRIIQMGEKSREAERNGKRFQMDEAALVNDFRMAISKLRSTEQLEIIKSALMALEIKNEKLRESRVEEKSQIGAKLKKLNSDGFETISLISGYEDKLNNREKEVDVQSKEEFSKKEIELNRKIEDLQEENRILTTNIEELDRQHSESIEKVLALKEELQEKHQSLQIAYERLYVDLNEMASQCEVLKSQNMKENDNIFNEKFSRNSLALQTDPPAVHESSVQVNISEETLSEISQKVKGILRNISLNVEKDETIFEAVAKQFVDIKWKKDVLERKVTEMTRELKQASDTKESLQMECDDMHANIESLILEIQHLKSNLPSIPEGSEEQVASLETKTESLQEQLKKYEEEIETLRQRNSEILVAKEDVKENLRSQENIELELRNTKKELKIKTPNDEEAESSGERASENFGQKLHATLEENNELKKRINMLENDQRQTQEQLTMSLEKCKGLDENIELIEELKLDLENVKRELKASISHGKCLENNFAAVQETKDEMERDNKVLSREVERLEADLLILKEAQKTGEDNNLLSDLRDQLYKVNSDKDDLEYDILNMRNELDEVISQLEVKQNEMENLQVDNGNLKLATDKLQVENDRLQKENDTFVEQLTAIQNECSEKVELLHTEKSLLEQENLEKIIQLENALLNSKSNYEKLQSENVGMEKEVESKMKNKMEEELKQAIFEKEQLSNRLEDKLAEFHSKDEELLAIRDHSLKLEEKLKEYDSLLNENSKLKAEIAENQHRFETSIESSKESAAMARETIESLSELIKEKDIEILKVKSSSINSESENELFSIKKERDELVKLVQAKHNESIQYHNEIQRLNQLLNEQVTSIHKLIAERDSSLETMKEREAEILWAQNELHVVRQRLKDFEESKDGERCGIVEHSAKIAQAAIFSEKCKALEAALIQEQNNNKIIQNQLTDSQNKELTAAKDLERLRSHLMEIESSYTQEALQAEEIRKDLEARLMQAEEKAKNSSTVYTSASIRANQQVETLQQQMSLIIQQRDDIQNKLSAAEDKILASTASLSNLQFVLEQFQRDKEKDIQAATEKIRQELNESYKKQEELSTEISSLKEQLAEAKECFKAASRLSEQLDKKSERIQHLNQEVAQLTLLVNTADQRIQQANKSGEGKVDKALVKNLMMGFLTSPANDKSSVLRVISTVLEFNEAEREKTGLNNPASKNSWFSTLHHSGGNAPSKDTEASLSAAFVKFLENESAPKPQLPALPLSNTPLTRPGHSRQHSTSSTQSTLLLSNISLPTFPDFVPARNTGSILKEVLKDS